MRNLTKLARPAAAATLAAAALIAAPAIASAEPSHNDKAPYQQQSPMDMFAGFFDFGSLGSLFGQPQKM
ncbi:hypothetical protein ONR57_13010 [Hoyosella sp. YIM 151337]|uniref:hypothetical protein n=1 Tax=Hoyosella sp. YIM 151337 TaxID=2992742 RepID=UPI00223674B4|nr:hypothetical protein [Hoyosella sp. YIM 151337]MCW4354219.1 hypothetical protein [Hoyosella sp. YIM 151337]